jgi:hypothetical protein
MPEGLPAYLKEVRAILARKRPLPQEVSNGLILAGLIVVAEMVETQQRRSILALVLSFLALGLIAAHTGLPWLVGILPLVP